MLWELLEARLSLSRRDASTAVCSSKKPLMFPRNPWFFRENRCSTVS